MHSSANKKLTKSLHNLSQAIRSHVVIREIIIARGPLLLTDPHFLNLGLHSVFPKILGPLFGSLGRLFGSLIFQLVIENILSRNFGPRQNMQHWGLSMTFGSFVDKHR